MKHSANDFTSIVPLLLVWGIPYRTITINVLPAECDCISPSSVVISVSAGECGITVGKKNWSVYKQTFIMATLIENCGLWQDALKTTENSDYYCKLDDNRVIPYLAGWFAGDCACWWSNFWLLNIVPKAASWQSAIHLNVWWQNCCNNKKWRLEGTLCNITNGSWHLMPVCNWIITLPPQYEQKKEFWFVMIFTTLTLLYV